MAFGPGSEVGPRSGLVKAKERRRWSRPLAAPVSIFARAVCESACLGMVGSVTALASNLAAHLSAEPYAMIVG